MKLTRKQIKFLKGLAHSLKPVVMIGKEGVSEAVTKEMSKTLSDHELIKIKIRCDEREDFIKVVGELEGLNQATLVHTLGRTAVFYRPSSQKDEDRKKPRIKLPRD